MEWTKPYYGVQHLMRPALPASHQATVTDYDSFSEASLFDVRTFRPIFEKTFPSAAEARAWLEKRVKAFLGPTTVIRRVA